MRIAKEAGVCLLTMALPSLVMMFYSVPGFRLFTTNILSVMGIKEYIKKIEIPIVILVYLVIPLLTRLVYFYFKSKNSDTNENFLTVLISHIDTILGSKNKRFYDFVRHNETIYPTDVFREIAQPIIQKTEIVKNIASFFSFFCNDHTVKVSLLWIDEANTIDYFIWLDGEPATDIKILNNKKSTAKYCLEEKKTILVEDTEKRNVKFMPNIGNTSNTKSIICHPVLKGSNIKYIICITSRNRNSFTGKNLKRFQYALEQFSKRIVLESYLDEIKEKLNGQEKNLLSGS
jgi:hypothetical protein